MLWLACGKKKQTVYDFIDWIGIDWMKNVKAVACDMNSDFEEAFKERCEWLDIVYDHFHLIKNFNDKVVSKVRKEEQKTPDRRRQYRSCQSGQNHCQRKRSVQKAKGEAKKQELKKNTRSCWMKTSCSSPWIW